MPLGGMKKRPVAPQPVTPAAPIEANAVYTLRRAARLLGMDPRSLHALIDAGKVAAVWEGGPQRGRQGNRMRIMGKALLGYLKSLRPVAARQ